VSYCDAPIAIAIELPITISSEIAATVSMASVMPIAQFRYRSSLAILVADGQAVEVPGVLRKKGKSPGRGAKFLISARFQKALRPDDSSGIGVERIPGFVM
jgi:hypothetical protein